MATSLVALRSKEPIRFAVESLDVSRRSGRGKVVNREEGFLGSEGESFERIAGTSAIVRPCPR
jgi:hypothetical protein